MANSAAVTVPPADEAITLREEVERGIGIEVARAAEALAGALVEYWNGGLSGATRSLSGDRIARLWELRCEFGAGFESVARRGGMQALLQQHGSALPERTLTVLVDGVLEILAKVVAFERAMAH